jgi:cob(I)alamin adenosyltransferase
VDKFARKDDGASKHVRASERIAHSRPRSRCSGAVDELSTHVGFARCICSETEARKVLEAVQMDLYKLGAVLAAPPDAKERARAVLLTLIDSAEKQIHRIKSAPGVLGNESLFWEQPTAAALDVARAICRRAERLAKSLIDSGAAGSPFIPVYLNRLAELLWLLARLSESRRGTGPQPES